MNAGTLRQGGVTRRFANRGFWISIAGFVHNLVSDHGPFEPSDFSLRDIPGSIVVDVTPRIAKGIALLTGVGVIVGAILGALFPRVFGFVFEGFFDV